MGKLNVSIRCRKTDFAMSKNALYISIETGLGQSADPVQAGHFLWVTWMNGWNDRKPDNPIYSLLFLKMGTMDSEYDLE